MTLGYLFSVDWTMTLFVMLPLLAGLGLFAAQVRKLTRHMGDYSKGMEGVNSAAIEFVQGISVVKTFGQAGRAHRRFIETTERLLGLLSGMMGGSLRSGAFAEVILAPVTALVVVMTAGSVLSGMGRIDPVDIIPFALLGLGLTGPILALWHAASAAVEAGAASRRVKQLLATETLAEPEAPNAPVDERLELQDVSFRYDGVHNALDGISLVLEPGTITALVGRSGSGKTTIAKLIPRFWDPATGRIMLGGVDIRRMASRELYRHVSFVFQDVQLLQTSVLDNIRLARPTATLAEVEAVARSAQIHQRILELPRGYDSEVGEDALFSGGEAQRVSIARALLADTPILVLDEATAFADPESEALIQDALSVLAAGRTLLVIAHRLSTIQNADQIVVLDRGRIAEQGTHADLLAQGGIYKKLWADHERAAAWRPAVAQGKATAR